MRRATLAAPSALAVLLAASCATAAERAPETPPAPPETWILSDRKAAGGWTQSYPVGNGSLGAMPLGAFPKETIYLNHDAIWTGKKHNPVAAGSRKADMDEAFALALKGDYGAAQGAYCRGKNKGAQGVATFQGLGTLQIEHAGVVLAGEAVASRRLDLCSGESGAATAGITQTVLASFPDGCVVVRLESAAGLHCKLNLGRARGVTRSAAQGAELLMEGQADGNGTKFAVRARVLPEGGGTLKVEGDALVLEGAKAATVVIACATDYHRDEPREPRTGAWAAQAQATLDKAAALGYEKLRARAAADHAALMGRCTLDLGATDPAVAALGTPERMERFRKGGADPDLVEAFFQYGRHLLVGSSRPGSLPPNLQGLWEGGMAAAWNGDFHLNINVQMNMWPADPTGLSECNEPYFHLLKLIHAHGRETAASLGCRGYAAALASDGWGSTEFTGGSPEWDSYALGGAWAQQHLMEHWRFTRDQKFLRESAWPILKDGALFMLDWLRVDPTTGLRVAGPGGSPENAFTYTGPDGKGGRAYIAVGNTHDHMLAWEVFSDTLEAAKILGIADDFTAQVAKALKQVPAPPIGADGRIGEWHRPLGEVWTGHRHKSHLHGLHPGRQITPAAPALYDAARKSLDFRMDPAHAGSDPSGHTGWNLAWSANLYARLHDGDRALAMVQEQLRTQVNDNLFNRCGGPWQIDGNLGTPAALAEMLLQSHTVGADGRPVIELLPALPKAWPDGEVNGLRARGNFEVDLKWQGGRVERYRIRSRSGTPALVRCNGQQAPLNLAKGAETTWQATR